MRVWCVRVCGAKCEGVMCADAMSKDVMCDV